MMKALTILLLLFLAGCDSGKVIDTYSVDVKVLEIDPPKHYYVTFQRLDESTKEKHRVSKRCSSYKKIKVGEVYKVKVAIKENSKGERTVLYTNLKEVFCPR